MSTIDFASLEDVLRVASQDHGGKSSKNATHGHRERYQWSYDVDFLGAVTLARRGWPDGTTLVAELARDLEIPVPTAYASYVLADDPSTAVGWDLSAVVAGDPDHWLTPTETPAIGRDIVVLVNPTAASTVSGDTMYRRGAATLAIVDALARAGHRVSVTMRVETLGMDHRTRGVYTCPLVRPGELLDIDRLAFVLAHPAMPRRIIFGIADADPDWRALGARGGLYGYSRDDTAPAVDLLMPGLRSDSSEDNPFGSIDSTRAWAIAQVTRITKGEKEE
jgi:hypothetical protein